MLLTDCIDKIIECWRDPEVYNAAIKIYALLPPLFAPILFWIDAPYGRFAGKLLFDWSFGGKYAWCIMEGVSPVMYTLSMLLVTPTTTPHEWQPSQVLLYGMWMTHYINRAFIHPYRAPSMAPIHSFAFLSAIFINVLNGYTNGVWNAGHAFPLSSTHVALGFGLWITGFAINIYHDNILFNLRRVKNANQRYFIPRGGLFEYVSCPNYLGETIEWAGLAIITGGSYPALAFLATTVGNLFPRANRAHAWYKDQFKTEYPSSRKAIIPYIL
ncbi:3-oxo-5-alpha-steroid 4-dehydrogenase-domain-containing protein [Zychaea mexicana]|uniref:3-oxo-5-alpha-steroid 4-dehydrogenase-domain-containing protein n=1 Tax=Zychaea mexicana TaxID=64656 RepID=UPI0022FE8A8B|nr:3-oxo-5-alpha-steroid 4-dehydrogenase-domain-containing protein [Zychaea mexicana]KAI9495318.1 3-oxo-5-alpha-steroid 4-dehydrogenase-domain-containing protein [Zychaea mexicana]